MDTPKAPVIVFAPSANRWHVPESFETERRNYQATGDRPSDIANNSFAEYLSDRITATEATDPNA